MKFSISPVPRRFQIKYYVINHSHITFIVVMEWTAELRVTKSLFRKVPNVALWCCCRWCMGCSSLLLVDEDDDLAKLKSFDICINFLLQCTNWSSFIHLFVSYIVSCGPTCVHSFQLILMNINEFSNPHARTQCRLRAIHMHDSMALIVSGELGACICITKLFSFSMHAPTLMR